MQEPTFNPFDPELTRSDELKALAAELRRTCPVARPVPGYAYLSRYADTRKAFMDYQRLSSRAELRALGVVVAEEEKFIGEMDRPLHTLFRRVLTEIFNPATYRAMEPFIGDQVDRLLDDLEATGGGDLMDRLTIPLPVAVTLTLLGLPLEDADQVTTWMLEMLHSDWITTNRNERGEGLYGGFPELMAYLDAKVEARRAAPPDPADLSFLSRVVRMDVDGKPLSTTQTGAQVLNVLIAGLSTTTSLLANSIYRLLGSPGLYTTVRSDRELVPSLIEESLRYDPPGIFMMRVADEDVPFSQGSVHAGEQVILSILSANRDESVFEDPDRFVVDRPWSLLGRGSLPPHLSFGAGPHTCPGAGLSRTEAAIALNKMFDRYAESEIRLAEGYVYEPVPNPVEVQPLRLDVEIVREAD